MKHALLAIYTDGHFSELVRVARLLARSASFEPVMYFARSYPQKERDLRVCREEGWRVLDHAPMPANGAAGIRSSSPPQASCVARAKHLLRAALVRLPFPFTVARAIYRQAQQLQLARRAIEETKPARLILAEDAIGYETAALIRAAHERCIPSLIVPFTIANALEPAEAYFRDPAYGMERFSNRLAAHFYPRWVFEHRGKRMVRLPAAQLLAREVCSLAPPIPWMMNSGAADAIALESPFMANYYRREGLSADKLVMTGALCNDVLAKHVQNAEAKRAELYEELGYPQDRRLLLCALPPDQFVFSGQQTDFVDYKAMVEFWIRAIARIPGWNVVVRLHPRQDYEQLRWIEGWGVRLCRWDTAALVPLADLYVASVSATIRWAIACGVPVVNYDAYRLRWTDYADAPGVLRVEERDAFVSIVHRLATDPAFYALVRHQQESDAPRWGQLDGRAGSRMLQLIDTLRVRAEGHTGQKEAGT